VRPAPSQQSPAVAGTDSAAEDVASYLRSKAISSAIGVAESVLNRPEVRKLIRRAMATEGLRQGAILCLLFAGVFSVINSIRSSLSMGPVFDAAVGSILLAASIVMMRLYSR